MRLTCERKRKAKRLLLVACSAAMLALLFYCVPWGVFVIIALLSRTLACWKILSD